MDHTIPYPLPRFTSATPSPPPLYSGGSSYLHERIMPSGEETTWSKIESSFRNTYIRFKIPAKESPTNSTRSRKLVDRQPGNMTLQHRQNLFKNKRSNLYLLGGLKRNKWKLTMNQYVRTMPDRAWCCKTHKTAYVPRTAAILGFKFRLKGKVQSQQSLPKVVPTPLSKFFCNIQDGVKSWCSSFRCKTSVDSLQRYAMVHYYYFLS